MPYKFSIRFSITKFIFVEKDRVFGISVHSGFSQILFQFPFGAESYSICLFSRKFRCRFAFAIKLYKMSYALVLWVHTDESSLVPIVAER